MKRDLGKKGSFGARIAGVFIIKKGAAKYYREKGSWKEGLLISK